MGQKDESTKLLWFNETARGHNRQFGLVYGKKSNNYSYAKSNLEKARPEVYESVVYRNIININSHHQCKVLNNEKFASRPTVSGKRWESSEVINRKGTYQCTSTPPPPSMPSRMKALLLGKCSITSSSSTSSISMEKCLYSLYNSWSSGSRNTDMTWVMLALFRATFPRSENSLVYA